MVISIKNETHPMELDVVAHMLTKELAAWNVKPIRVSHTELRVEVPTEKWFDSIKEAVEFMTECGVEIV